MQFFTFNNKTNATLSIKSKLIFAEKYINKIIIQNVKRP